MTLKLTFDLDLDMELEHIVMTYLYYKNKVKCQGLGHYPAKLLKRFTFVQNIFTFFYVPLSILFTIYLQL